MKKPAETTIQIIKDRTERVIQLHVEGNTLRGIVAALDAEGYRNKRGKPWSLAAVRKDLDVVYSIWKEKMAATVDRHRSAHLLRAEYLWVRAIEIEDYKTAHEVLKTMIKLLGTEMPQRHTVEGGDKPIVISILPPGLWENL